MLRSTYKPIWNGWNRQEEAHFGGPLSLRTTLIFSPHMFGKRKEDSHDESLRELTRCSENQVMNANDYICEKCRNG